MFPFSSVTSEGTGKKRCPDDAPLPARPGCISAGSDPRKGDSHPLLQRRAQRRFDGSETRAWESPANLRGAGTFARAGGAGRGAGWGARPAGETQVFDRRERLSARTAESAGPGSLAGRALRAATPTPRDLLLRRRLERLQPLGGGVSWGAGGAEVAARKGVAAGSPPQRSRTAERPTAGCSRDATKAARTYGSRGGAWSRGGVALACTPLPRPPPPAAQLSSPPPVLTCAAGLPRELRKTATPPSIPPPPPPGRGRTAVPGALLDPARPATPRGRPPAALAFPRAPTPARRAARDAAPAPPAARRRHPPAFAPPPQPASQPAGPGSAPPPPHRSQRVRVAPPPLATDRAEQGLPGNGGRSGVRTASISPSARLRLSSSPQAARAGVVGCGRRFRLRLRLRSAATRRSGGTTRPLRRAPGASPALRGSSPA